MSDETKTEAPKQPTIPGAQIPQTLEGLNNVLAILLNEATKGLRAERARLSVPTKAADDSARHAPPEDQAHFKHLSLAVVELGSVQGGVARALDAWGRFVALSNRAQDGLDAHKTASGS